MQILSGPSPDDGDRSALANSEPERLLIDIICASLACAMIDIVHRSNGDLRCHGGIDAGEQVFGRGAQKLMHIKERCLSRRLIRRTMQAVPLLCCLGAHTCTEYACVRMQERRRSSGTAASMLETEVGALREQSLTHVKERVALKAILDDKVRALISDIGQSVAELPIEVRRLASVPNASVWDTCPLNVPQHTLTVLCRVPVRSHMHVCSATSLSR